MAVVGRYAFDVEDAGSAGDGGDQRWAVRDTVLGHGYGRFCADEGVYGRVVCAVVSVQRVLSVVSLPWENVDAAAAVGMGHGDVWAGGGKRVRGGYVAEAGGPA